MKESGVGGWSGGIACNCPPPRRCCFVTGFRPDTNSWFSRGVIFLPRGVFTELLLGFPLWGRSKLTRLTFTTEKKATNFSFSAWYQGNIEAYFDSLSSPSEETAALAQHLQYFCLTPQWDKAVPWWMSERDIGFWSGTESLSSFLSLDTPFQLVNLDICLNFICLIEFMSYLTANLPSSWRAAWWSESHGVVPAGGATLLDSHVQWHPSLAKKIHGLPRHRLIHFLRFSRGISGFKPAESQGGTGLESPTPW